MARAATALHSLAGGYGDVLRSDGLDTGKLLVSELVTYAVAHGVGRIRLCADLDDERLRRVEVVDEGAEFDHLLRAVSFDERGGFTRGHNPLDPVGGLSSREPDLPGRTRRQRNWQRQTLPSAMSGRLRGFMPSAARQSKHARLISAGRVDSAPLAREQPGLAS